jgi:hypothetical protein
MRRILQVALILGLGLLGLFLLQVRGGEVLWWGIVPTAAALGAMGLSASLVIRRFGPVQLALSVPVVLVSGFSLVVLERIFIDGAWPTFLPHLAIFAACLLVGIQLWWAERGDRRRLPNKPLQPTSGGQAGVE